MAQFLDAKTAFMDKLAGLKSFSNQLALQTA